MSSLKLRVITPRKIVKEEDIYSVTAMCIDGEVTILPRHSHFFSLLKEGIVKIKKQGDEEHLAVGGGYLETDGKEVHLLVARAYGQADIDERQTEEAIARAQKLLAETKDTRQRQEATALLRRSVIDMKLIKRRRTRTI